MYGVLRSYTFKIAVVVVVLLGGIEGVSKVAEDAVWSARFLQASRSRLRQ